MDCSPGTKTFAAQSGGAVLCLLKRYSAHASKNARSSRRATLGRIITCPSAQGIIPPRTPAEPAYAKAFRPANERGSVARYAVQATSLFLRTPTKGSSEVVYTTWFPLP